MMSTGLSLVPTLLMAVRFSDSGVSVIRRLPTAITGAAAGRTSAAPASPTPTATAAVTNPMRAPTSRDDLTGPPSLRRDRPTEEVRSPRTERRYANGRTGPDGWV